ncbi:MAG: type II toxin-antitoxin system MqsA family antitoxin [Chloroflexi bacterium]|nr:type II toxin-antitoxin system MqsA family antitoxin [Chloroflexota bacterium]
MCGGKLEDKTVTHPQEYKGKLVILENVPAEVCQQCGEVLFRPEVVEKMQRLVWSEAEPRRTTCLPVYDLAEAG